jgi:two-component system sensor histidine kinase CpxA
LRLHIRLHSERPWWIQPSRQVMPDLGRDAAATYETGQQAALRILLDRLSLKGRTTYWLLDDSGHELSGRPLPDEVRRLIGEATQREGSVRSDDFSVAIAPVDTGHSKYLLVTQFVPPPLSERVPGDILWTMKLGTLVSAILCLIIAHYLSKPIERLRDATNELARGNLDIRVGRSIGNRRDEIADLVRDFDSMAGELRILLQNERNLLTGVSHELRSPIARMRLALALARSGEPQETEEMLDRIEQDTIQLDSMLERILTVARLESGQQKLRLESCSLNEIVDDVLQDARFEAASVNAEISYTADPDLRLEGDPALLRSVVENLVRNAIFYSGEGGRITVSLRRDDGFASFTVRDNGPGVPEEALPLLFKPFYRVDNARGTQTGGMGLGLAIVRNAVLAHGGTVVAGNVVPHGLRMDVRLPVAPFPAVTTRLNALKTAAPVKALGPD